MNIKEAKEILRSRYQKRGFKVNKIVHRGDQFWVSFGTSEEGKGLGPQGLSSIICNTPKTEEVGQFSIPFPITQKKSRRSRV